MDKLFVSGFGFVVKTPLSPNQFQFHGFWAIWLLILLYLVHNTFSMQYKSMHACGDGVACSHKKAIEEMPPISCLCVAAAQPL